MTDSNEVDRNDDIRRMLKAAGQLESPDADRKAQAMASVRAAWQESVDPPVTATRRRWTLPVGLAAVIALTVSVLAINPFQPKGPEAVAQVVKLIGEGASVPAVISTGATVETRSNQQLTLKLISGHLLHLDHATRLRVNGVAQFALERGRIYVDHAAAKTDSIEVRTAFGRVTDIGTQFEVSVLDGLRVAMREGAVDVYLNGQVAGRRMLAAGGVGDVLTVDQNDNITTATIDATAARWQWVRSTAPAFPSGESQLADVLEWVERQSGRSVEFAEPLLALRAESERVSWPAIEAADAEQRLKHLIQTTNGFDVHYTPTSIVISRRR